MPVQRPAEATETPGVYRVSYPVKPGETEFTIAYTLPSTEQFTSRKVTKVETRLVVPRGLTLAGDGVSALGMDPSGRAALYSVSGEEYSVTIAGTAAAQNGAASEEEDTGAPRIQQKNPRLYGQLPVVLALAFAVLLLGFVLLYQSTRAGKPENSPGAKGKSGDERR
jgi:hypothetical protein